MREGRGTIRSRLAAVATAMGEGMLRLAGAPDQPPGPQLDPGRVALHNQRNKQQTLVLSAAMAVLLLAAVGLLAGKWGVLLVAASLASMVLMGPKVAPETVMRTYGGERVEGPNGRVFLDLIAELSRRAELPTPPVLYVIPSATLNAFAVGTRAHSAVAVTEGLLRRLQLRELAGVLAHEISHIRNGDLWIMGLADGMTRMARVVSLMALALLALNLLSVAIGGAGMSWIGLLLLYLTPAASSLLQLALGRTREHDADLDGVTLTGDPEGLASALLKVDAYQGRPWEDLVFGRRRVPQPSVLRTHPSTPERVARLRALAANAGAFPPLVVREVPLMTGKAGIGTSALQPRYRWSSGAWY